MHRPDGLVDKDEGPRKLVFAALVLAGLFLPLRAWGHFGALIPSDDIVSQGESTALRLSLMFLHPFEGRYMEMGKPRAFGVMVRGKRQDLMPSLAARKIQGFTSWEARYAVRRPGDHVFFFEPAPYWEPAEEKFIVHCTKVVVHALGLEEGWDRPAGLPAEILPMTRPYGLWAGNVFQGVVLMNGKAVPGAEVEVEYLGNGSVEAPSDPYVTQVVKADAGGVFTYAMPKAGWWGFAALMGAPYKIEREGKSYPVELGAVIWVRSRDMGRRSPAGAR